MSRYTVKTPLSIALWGGGGELEFDAIISFRAIPGRLATNLTPAEEPTVEVTRFQIARAGAVIADCPDWLFCRFENDDSFNAWLLEEAEEQTQEAKEAMADLRREERRLGL